MIKRATSKDGKPFFKIVSRNGKILMVSETYQSKAGMEKGIRAIKKAVKNDWK